MSNINIWKRFSYIFTPARKDPYIIRIGGSIPILSAFLKHLGVHATMFAFGLDDEQIHAPNEFFRLESFEKRRKHIVCF